MKNMKPLTIQPIPYQGSKRALAPRICQYFPEKIATFYEPFAGSAAITIYAASNDLADSFVIGDSFACLIDLWDLIINNPTELSERYSDIWHQQFNVGENHFKDMREQYNEEKDPVILLYLIARCVKNAVRFNKHGYFTQSADKRRTGMKPDRLTRTAHAVSLLLKGRTRLFSGDFTDCILNAGKSDFVYMDPPYQGTTYGSDKRYASQLCRTKLIEGLHELDKRKVPYILSYDGRMGEKSYGEPLPDSVLAHHYELEAGRSSQATLSGRSDLTFESLYVSQAVAKPISLNNPLKETDQKRLFA